MDSISVSFEFILDKQNKLVRVADMINNDGLMMALSFAPVGVAAASVVGGIARKMLNTFLEADERQPILQFEGAFNLAYDGLQEGYYAILGTRDDKNPLPRPLPNLSVRDGDLLADGVPITQWSYVLLEIHRLDALGRDRGVGQPWHKKLIDAENIAQDVENEGPNEDERKIKFQMCQNLLKESPVQFGIKSEPTPKHEIIPVFDDFKPAWIFRFQTCKLTSPHVAIGAHVIAGCLFV